MATSNKLVERNTANNKRARGKPHSHLILQNRTNLLLLLNRWVYAFLFTILTVYFTNECFQHPLYNLKLKSHFLGGIFSGCGLFLLYQFLRIHTNFPFLNIQALYIFLYSTWRIHFVNPKCGCMSVFWYLHLITDFCSSEWVEWRISLKMGILKKHQNVNGFLYF